MREHLKISNDESDAAISGEEEEAFVCDMSGECNDESNDEGGCSALAWQVGDLTVICDSGATCHLSHSSTGIMHYRESNAYMRTASGARYSTEGYGDLPFTFRYSFVTDTGHTYTGAHEGDTVFLFTGETLF